MPSEPRLRDQLCELEPQNPLLRERYTQEIRAMFEKKVTSSMKGVLGAVGLGSVGIAAWLGWHAVVRDELPGLARVGLAGGALFSAGWAYLCGRALRRGVWELWVQSGGAVQRARDPRGRRSDDSHRERSAGTIADARGTAAARISDRSDVGESVARLILEAAAGRQRTRRASTQSTWSPTSPPLP